MTPDQWKQVKDILVRAIDEPPEERASYVRNACGNDAEILREVNSLLPFYEQASRDSQAHTTDSVVPLPDRVNFSIANSLAGTRVGHYELTQRLGAGGMGEIYLAERVDDDFQQKVAIKFIRRHLVSDDFIAHFRQEKQILATLVHDHIAHLYDAGATESGWPYIVMEYVEGSPIHHYCNNNNLDTRRRIRLLASVCSAVHSAHQARVIHRDIKPANILVTEDGSPKLLDFGIARVSSAKDDKLGLPGLQAMTPEYAAPEQFLGENITTAADIYALGVLLYRLVTDKMPYEVEGLTIGKIRGIVLKHDPTPPTHYKPELRPELEAVILKCLEKDPQNRYASARALEEDLRRILACEPINIWSHKFTYVLKTNIRKNSVAVSIGAIALLSVALVVGWSIWQQYNARERERLVLLFGQEAERIEARARYAFMLPSHDIRPAIDKLERELLRINENITGGGERGVRYARAALGRGHLSLGDTRKARTFLENAWQDGFRDPRVAYALGHCLVEAYQDALEDLERLRRLDKEDWTTQRRQINRELLEPALAYLQEARKASIEEADYAAALSAYYQTFVNGEDEDDKITLSVALDKARSVSKKLPWLFEAYRLQGHILMERGNEKRNRGDYNGAMAEYEEAQKALEHTVLIAPSFNRAWYDLGFLNQKMMQTLQIGHGGDVSPYFEKGLAACKRALEIDPGNHHAYRVRSYLYQRMAQYTASQGQNPEQYLEEAVMAATNGMALTEQGSDDMALALQAAASAWHILANYQKSIGQDPRPSYQKGIDANEKVTRYLPRYVNYNSLGRMHRAVSEYEMAIGVDPSASLTKAEAAFKNAISVSSESTGVHVNLSFLYWTRAEYAKNSGKDPLKWLDLSIEAGADALEINPNKTSAYNNMALSLATRGNYLRHTGRDGRADMLEAVKAYGKAIEINPRREPIAGLAESRYFLALDAWDRGSDLMSDLEKALETNKRCLKMVENYHHALLNQGHVYALLARYRHATGQDPGEALELARRHYQKITETKSTRFPSRIALAELKLYQAQWLWEKGQDPEPALDAAEKAVLEAWQIHQEHWQIDLIRGRHMTLKALYSDHTDNKTQLWRAAEQYLTEAAAGAPFAREIPLARAEWAVAYSAQQPADRKKILEAIEFGLEQVRAAQKINPNLAEAKALEGLLHWRAHGHGLPGDHEAKAAELLNAACKANQYLARRYQPVLLEIRTSIAPE